MSPRCFFPRLTHLMLAPDPPSTLVAVVAVVAGLAVVVAVVAVVAVAAVAAVVAVVAAVAVVAVVAVAVVAAVPSVVPCETFGGPGHADLSRDCRWLPHFWYVRRRLGPSVRPPSVAVAPRGGAGKKVYICRGPAGRCRTVGLASMCSYGLAICLATPRRRRTARRVSDTSTESICRGAAGRCRTMGPLA